VGSLAPAVMTLALLGLATHAAAAGEGGRAIGDDASAEALHMPSPVGWRPIHRLDAPHLRIQRYAVPSEDGAIETVRFEWFEPPLAHPDPLEFVEGFVRRARGSCDRLSDQGVFAGEENGYPTVVRLLVCPQLNARDAGELMMLKAVQGDHGFWLAVRSRPLPAPGSRGAARQDGSDARAAPTEVVARWSEFLRAIRVCNAGDDAHPCP